MGGGMGELASPRSAGQSVEGDLGAVTHGRQEMFVREIQEQPEAVREVVRYYGAEGAGLLDQLVALRRRDAEQPGPVFFTGMGSSLYATEAVLPALAAGGIDARVIEAGEWLHYCP